jgi:hypothetical protein
VSYGSCLARKYLFGLWKGAQNPPEFFLSGISSVTLLT